MYKLIPVAIAALLMTPETQALSHNSIPACNSLGCKKGTAEDTGEAYLSQKESIPACNSYECKTGTAIDDNGDTFFLQKQHHDFIALQADMQSDPYCKNGNCFIDTAAPHAIRPEDDHPMNYPVTNLGMDRDIMATFKHMRTGEEMFGEWTPLVSRKKAASHPVDYPVNDLGMDKDIA